MNLSRIADKSRPDYLVRRIKALEDLVARLITARTLDAAELSPGGAIYLPGGVPAVTAADGAVNVLAGTQGSTDAVSITRTTGGSGSSQAAIAGDLAIGDGAIAEGNSGTPPLPGDTSAVAIGLESFSHAHGTAVGGGAISGVAGVTVGSAEAWAGAPGQTSVGQDLIISAPYSTVVGYQGQSGDYGTSDGGAYSTTLGAFASAKKDGSVAVGADHTGAGAVSDIQDEIVLGTDLHRVKVPGLRASIKTVTADYTLQPFDHTVLADGTLTLTLPLASTAAGQLFTVKNVGSGVVTLAAA